MWCRASPYTSLLWLHCCVWESDDDDVARVTLRDIHVVQSVTTHFSSSLTSLLRLRKFPPSTESGFLSLGKPAWVELLHTAFWLIPYIGWIFTSVACAAFSCCCGPWPGLSLSQTWSQATTLIVRGCNCKKFAAPNLLRRSVIGWNRKRTPPESAVQKLNCKIVMDISMVHDP